jgi:hypothetical protein
MIRISTWIAFPVRLRRNIQARRLERADHKARVARRLLGPVDRDDRPIAENPEYLRAVEGESKFTAE